MTNTVPKRQCPPQWTGVISFVNFLAIVRGFTVGIEVGVWGAVEGKAVGSEYEGFIDGMELGRVEVG